MIKKTKFFSEKKVNFSTWIYLINEYVNYCSNLKKNSYESIFKLGEQVGPRIFEAEHFYKEKNQNSKRIIKNIDILRYITQTVWPLIFDTSLEPVLEKYVNYRTHPITGNYVSDYIIIDNDPIYKQHNRNDVFQSNFFAGLIKGILCYSGFDCDVKIMDENKAQGKPKVEYVVLFSWDVMDRDGNN